MTGALIHHRNYVSIYSTIVFLLKQLSDKTQILIWRAVLALSPKGYKNPRFIMTYTRWWSWRIWLFYYTLLFTKPKQHVIEIIYGRGKFVGDFNMGRGKFVIWVHYKGMWIKNLLYICYYNRNKLWNHKLFLNCMQVDI